MTPQTSTFDLALTWLLRVEFDLCRISSFDSSYFQGEYEVRQKYHYLRDAIDCKKIEAFFSEIRLLWNVTFDRVAGEVNRK